jgi:signal transduction histidine kinase
MEKLGQETKNAAILAERGRLAGEIHDSLQQGLSGLILQLDATLKMPALTPEVRSRLNTARSMVSFSRHEVQNAIWDLESPLLEGVELTQALQKLINLISVGPARVELVIEGKPIDLSQAIQHHLLRIAQEALTNAVRHAEATLVVIKLIYKESHVELVVEDDGKGFETTKVLSKGIGHFGLRGLKVRADKIGAELNIISAPGQGTRLRVVVGAAESLSNETYAIGRPH